MAQIVTITNPLTGQPVQVDQLYHTAQDIDNGIDAAGIESADYPGCYYRMVGGVVEWLNPPMSIGVEYRTTERYMSKPVYVKLVDCGLVVNGKKQVTHGIANCDYVIRHMGCVDKDALPILLNKSWDDMWICYFGKVTNTTIEIYGGSGSAGKQVYCTMWYTKTTD